MNPQIEFGKLLTSPVPLLALAPMQDVTDLPFLRLMTNYGGADVYFTEYFRVHATSNLEKHILRSITENPTGRRRCQQPDPNRRFRRSASGGAAVGPARLAHQQHRLARRNEALGAVGAEGGAGLVELEGTEEVAAEEAIFTAGRFRHRSSTALGHAIPLVR